MGADAGAGRTSACPRDENQVPSVKAAHPPRSSALVEEARRQNTLEVSYVRADGMDPSSKWSRRRSRSRFLELETSNTPDVRHFREAPNVLTINTLAVQLAGARLHARANFRASQARGDAPIGTAVHRPPDARTITAPQAFKLLVSGVTPCVHSRCPRLGFRNSSVSRSRCQPAGHTGAASWQLASASSTG
jgi:hypothetical protein